MLATYRAVLKVVSRIETSKCIGYFYLVFKNANMPPLHILLK